MKKLTYKHTIYACFIGYIVQAIVNNFVPLLFLTFHETYGIPFSKITFLVTFNFALQMLVDAVSAGFIDKIGYRAAAVLAHIFAVAGFILLTILPSDVTNCCVFLNGEGRCSIHSFRPGICKLFPLGRVYEDNKLMYFLQLDGCKKENRSKIKVSKWLDTAELKKNQQYLIDWHGFRKQMEEIIADTPDENTVKTITMFLLNTFYGNPYNLETDFYQQFYERMNKIKSALNL